MAILTSEQNEKLAEMLQVLGAERKHLDERSRNFVDQIIQRHEQYAERIFLSPKQWDWLDSLYAKVTDVPQAREQGRNRLDDEDDDGIPF